MALVDLVVHFGLFLGIIVLGIWLERRTGSAHRYRGLGQWGKLLTGAIAFGVPWLPYWEGYYPALPPDPLHWVIGLNLVLWIGMPFLLGTFVETDRPETAC